MDERRVEREPAKEEQFSLSDARGTLFNILFPRLSSRRGYEIVSKSSLIRLDGSVFRSEIVLRSYIIYEFRKAKVYT